MNPFWSTIVTAVISSLGGGGIVSLITFFVTRHDKKKEKEEANDTAQSKMLMGLAHDRILHICDGYVKRGYVTTEEYDDLEKYLYIPYTLLGGNGTAERALEKVKELPTRKEQ